MVEICQIPASVLHGLSTQDLVKICLDYPLFFTLTAFNNMQEGFEQVSTEFNGFNELYNRQDAAKELLTFYRSLDPRTVDQKETNLDRGKFKFQIFYLEFMIAQDIIYDNISQSDMKELAGISHQMAKQKQQAGYSLFLVQTSYLVMARLLGFVSDERFLKEYSDNPALYSSFINTVFLYDPRILNEIDTLTADFIHE